MGQGWGREDKPAVIYAGVIGGHEDAVGRPERVFALQRLRDWVQPCAARTAYTATVSGREWGRGLAMHGHVFFFGG